MASATILGPLTRGCRLTCIVSRCVVHLRIGTRRSVIVTLASARVNQPSDELLTCYGNSESHVGTQPSRLILADTGQPLPFSLYGNIHERYNVVGLRPWFVNIYIARLPGSSWIVSLIE